MSGKKIAAVTGGNRGIGFQICRDLARHNVKVLLTARDNDRGEAAAKILQEDSLEVEFRLLDVSSELSIVSFVKDVLKDYSKIDILINNAAIIPEAKSSALNVSLEEIKVSMETNVYGALMLSQKIIPSMIKNNYGRIINFSSGMGQFADMGSGQFAYRLTKTSINVLSRVLANETAGYDIQINSVDPGWVKTEMGGSGAYLSLEEGADTAVWLATRSKGEPSGKFYKKRNIIDW